MVAAALPEPAHEPAPIAVVEPVALPEPAQLAAELAPVFAAALPEPALELVVEPTPQPVPAPEPALAVDDALPEAAAVVTPVMTPAPVDPPPFAIPLPRREPRRIRPAVPAAPGPDEAFGRWNNVAAGVTVLLAVALRIPGGLSPFAGGTPSPPTTVAAADDTAGAPTPLAAAAAAKARADHDRVRVIIVSEDGMRRDVLNDEYAPRHTALMREGMVARRALTIRQSETLPSHASMLSGVGPEVHGMRWNTFRKERGYIDVPTVFSVARNHGLSTAMIIGKRKLEHLAKPGTVDHYERPSHYCKKVSARAAEYFVEAKPDIMFVHFSDPDDAGHSKGWMTPAYLAAVRQSDKCLAHLLSAIDAAGLGESTMIIVTADHGGHDKTHSNGHHYREVDQVIPWIVRGPGIPAGGVLDEEVATIDTAVTALSALRLPVAGMAGVSRLPALMTTSAPAALR
jgi:hypothetical protein